MEATQPNGACSSFGQAKRVAALQHPATAPPTSVLGVGVRSGLVYDEDPAGGDGGGGASPLLRSGMRGIMGEMWTPPKVVNEDVDLRPRPVEAHRSCRRFRSPSSRLGRSGMLERLAWFWDSVNRVSRASAISRFRHAISWRSLPEPSALMAPLASMRALSLAASRSRRNSSGGKIGRAHV